MKISQSFLRGFIIAVNIISAITCIGLVVSNITTKENAWFVCGNVLSLSTMIKIEKSPENTDEIKQKMVDILGLDEKAVDDVIEQATIASQQKSPTIINLNEPTNDKDEEITVVGAKVYENKRTHNFRAIV